MGPADADPTTQATVIAVSAFHMLMSLQSVVQASRTVRHVTQAVSFFQSQKVSTQI
eukprot:m.432217 g.432217  ORF g.432217 m.432217 type:complete len:56 (-) comp17401_c0_seq1:101-268(-)